MTSAAPVILAYVFSVAAAVGPTAPAPPADISLEDALADMRRVVSECRKLATDPDGSSYAHDCITHCERDIATLPGKSEKFRPRDVQRCRTKLLMAQEFDAQTASRKAQSAQAPQAQPPRPGAAPQAANSPKPAATVAAVPAASVKPAAPPAPAATAKPAGKPADGIVRQLGFEAENPLFDLVFHGLYPTGDNMATRSMLMIYAEYSDDFCKENTPNGARESSWTWTTEMRNVYGTVYKRDSTTHTTWVDVALVGTFESYRFSLPPEARLQNTGSIEETMSVMMRSYEPALAARRDMQKLFGTGCKSRHVRQMNENLARMVRGRPSLQDDRDELLPMALVVQDACEAHLASVKGESSGYRLKSCGCMAEHVGKKLVRGDKFALRAAFNSLQVALIGYKYQTPAVVQQCMVRDTRPGAGTALARVERPAASAAPVVDPASDPAVACTLAMRAARDRVLSADWCGATKADIQRAIDEMKKVNASAVCGGTMGGDAMFYVVEDTVQRRCKAQQSGTASEDEARLIERMDPTRGCSVLADPKVEPYVRSITQTMSRDDATRRLARLGPIVPKEDGLSVSAKACAGLYLLGKWAGGAH